MEPDMAPRSLRMRDGDWVWQVLVCDTRLPVCVTSLTGAGF